jgi:predicted transporter
MTIAKVLAQALAIIASELLVTAIFVVVVVPMLIGVKQGNAIGFQAIKVQAAVWVTVTSPFYWLLLFATVTVVIWPFRR